MGTPIKDISLPDNAPKTLLLQKHTDYIAAYGDKKDDYEYIMTEYLRMNGMYWGLTAMALAGQLERMKRDEVIGFIKACQTECGGMACSIGHDPHLLSTLSAVQILTLYDAVDALNIESLVSWVVSLQQDDGSFFGDKWGEVDTRFSFCAVACLSLLDIILTSEPEWSVFMLFKIILSIKIDHSGSEVWLYCGRLDAIKVDKAVEFVLSCMNFDGGFGCRPGSESHSGQIYCCVGLLAITGRLHHVNVDQLGWWLCERQLPSGGLNGRPEKLPDVCYSWWVLASMAIIGRLHWIDKEKLKAFMLACQDEDTGGFADRPGDMVDPFHTLFGLAGLSLLGDPGVKPVNPVYCMPEDIIRRLGLSIYHDS